MILAGFVFSLNDNLQQPTGASQPHSPRGLSIPQLLPNASRKSQRHERQKSYIVRDCHSLYRHALEIIIPDASRNVEVRNARCEEQMVRSGIGAEVTSHQFRPRVERRMI
jgi:hypothetical protein